MCRMMSLLALSLGLFAGSLSAADTLRDADTR
jgi:hypothetical protein